MSQSTSVMEVEMNELGQQNDDVLSVSSVTHETELRKDLKERHVNMIGFSMALGIGLFLSAGKIIFIAGPGVAVIAYLVMGTFMWSSMASMGEMTALFPLRGPTFEFARRFLDESVGLATAWMMWFSWVTIVAAEILAITQLFHFDVDGVSPGYLSRVAYPEQSIRWWYPNGPPKASVWVIVFLPVMLLINLLPVKYLGRIEYIFGCIKISFLVALILFNFCIANRGFWTYNEEQGLGFSTPTYTPKNDSTYQPPVEYTGSLAKITSLWSAMTTSLFSMLGFVIILMTAPENRDLHIEETIKLSSRKISIRVIVLYTLAVFSVGLNVPYNDEILKTFVNKGVKGGDHSIFVLAAVRAGVPFFPHFMNGFFIFSACSTGINGLYGASRMLHAIAGIHDAWPQWMEGLRVRLERTRMGVPMNAVVLSWLLGLGLAFLSTDPRAEEELERIVSMAISTTIIVYVVNAFAFMAFFKEINAAAAGERDEELRLTPAMRAHYKRSAKHYPYYSHMQWLRAAYSLFFGVLVLLFQGWISVVPPFNARGFVADYISLVIFGILTAAYFFTTRGFKPRNWLARRSKLEGLEAVGPIVVVDSSHRKPCKTCGMAHRRGKLVWPKEKGFSKQKARVILEWIWTWLK